MSKPINPFSGVPVSPSNSVKSKGRSLSNESDKRGTERNVNHRSIDLRRRKRSNSPKRRSPSPSYRRSRSPSHRRSRSPRRDRSPRRRARKYSPRRSPGRRYRRSPSPRRYRSPRYRRSISSSSSHRKRSDSPRRRAYSPPKRKWSPPPPRVYRSRTPIKPREDEASKKFKFDSPPRAEEVVFGLENAITSQPQLFKSLQGSKLSTFVASSVQSQIIISTKASLNENQNTTNTIVKTNDVTGVVLTDKELSLLDPLRNNILKEVYITGIPINTTSQWMIDTINDIFINKLPILVPNTNMNLNNKKACLKIWIDEDGREGCALIRSIEESSLLISIGTITLNSNITLYFTRPKGLLSLQLSDSLSSNKNNYIDNLLKPDLKPLFDSIYKYNSNNNTQTRLCICGIPQLITESILKEVLLSFGPIKFFFLVQDHSNSDLIHAGIALVEFEHKVHEKLCIQYLNKYKSYSAPSNASSIDVNITDSDYVPGVFRVYNANDPTVEELVTKLLSESNKSSRAVVGKNKIIQPSKCIYLHNFVSVNELLDDEEYDEISMDIRLELEKFGNVNKFVLPRPNESNDYTGVGYCFAEFEHVEDATLAKRNLNGRKFGNKEVISNYFSQKKMDNNDFNEPTNYSDYEI